MIELFEIFARIIQFVKTLIYVFITMLVLAALFGYAHLTETVMAFILVGIMWGVGFLAVDFAFSPGQLADGEVRPSRIKSTSSGKRMFTVIVLSVWFLVLIGFSSNLLYQLN